MKRITGVENRRRVLIVAGEASADLHGSHLVKAILKNKPAVEFWGIGGTNMAEAGVNILVSSSDMAVVGLTEVLSRFQTIVQAANTMKSALRRLHPDLLILIDYPDFNLHLAGTAKRLRVPVLYYISPQVWAWRRGRIRKIARRVDRMAVILPFEESFYRKRGMRVDYVGHPLLDAFESRDPGPDFKRYDEIDGIGPPGLNPVIGLLPGSRREEIRKLLPVMIEAVEILKGRYPRIRCILPLAKTINGEMVERFIQTSVLPVDIRSGDIYGALSECHMALVASGTATLDVAIMGVPMVVAYKIAPISYRLGRMLIRVPFIGLVNLVAGKQAVPELIQQDVTPKRLAEAALPLLESASIRDRMITELRSVRKRLGSGGASKRAARIAIEMMQ